MRQTHFSNELYADTAHTKAASTKRMTAPSETLCRLEPPLLLQSLVTFDRPARGVPDLARRAEREEMAMPT